MQTVMNIQKLAPTNRVY